MAGGLDWKAAEVVAVLGWFLLPIITFFLPKILARLGFDVSKELQKLEIHTIPDLKRTLQAVDQERMMQRGKRANTDLDALHKMTAMLRHALEDAEDIFDDAEHKIVLGCWHRLCGASATCIALCKSSCFWIARMVRTKSDWILQWARNSSSSLFLVRRSEEPVPANISAAADVSDEPVPVTIDIPDSDDENVPVTTGAAASDHETVPMTIGAMASAEPAPVTTGAEACGDEIAPVTTGDAASDDETIPATTSDEIVSVTTSAEASDDMSEPMTTTVEASDKEPHPVWSLSCLCSLFDFKNWLLYALEHVYFCRDWPFQVVGIQKNARRMRPSYIYSLLLSQDGN